VAINRNHPWGIRGHPWLSIAITRGASEAIRGHQSQSPVGHQRPSVAINRNHPWGIRGHPWLSIAITRESSEAIRSNHLSPRGSMSR
jgi:hypothetical protein